METKTVEIVKWIIENKEEFVPPVCNKCMFSDYLKVFFVGGPNSRRDYHMEEGEEFFHQMTGDMVLKVIERGVPRDITIREGEIFLLPSRVEHSPQRSPNTIGFVVERTRDNTEFDCVRYIYQMFEDQELIKRRAEHCSSIKITRRLETPGPKSFLINAPYEPVPMDLAKPMNLLEYIDNHKDALRSGPLQIYGAPTYSTDVWLYGEGKYSLDSQDYELLIWTMEKSLSVLETSDEGRPLEAMSMTRCPAQTK
ncbi:putative 3-hydroxyanthranilate 3,4-dioxygenase [Teladorsagia circumcincta]|uniref:Putative 3-hydroxyanthranilate 3,4-dioxygenase n=1 Tax=Teladorsagia circumcincta TaxID=45464 RepID=A0A2G9V1B3_TELCI|nr:putative 3-hydroxyanthranilate 3,4-dioxygenase [Teladorsagia circumcincta]